MPTMPTVTVEIAFNATYSTPTASRTWTDVSSYVSLEQGISINYGRQDELSQADANTLSLTLDNRDGRFTPGLSTSPYYPNVKIGRPIRVTSTPSDGTASTRFVGFIEEWPVSFPGTDARSWVQVSATSRIARLGLDRPARNIVTETILPDAPLAYYTFGEEPGAVLAADSSGRGAQSLTMYGAGTAPDFGSVNGPTTDGLTSATFSPGTSAMQSFPSISGGEVTIECFLYFPTGTSGTTTVMEVVDGAYNGLVFRVSSPGSGNTSYRGVGPNGGTQIGLEIGNFFAGSLHHWAFVHDGVQTLRTYWDGDLHYTDNLSLYAKPWGYLSNFRVFSLFSGTTPPPCTISHAAVYGWQLSASQIAAHATAGLNGFAGETGDTRFSRYTSWASIPSSETTIDAASSVAIGHEDTDGKQIIELLRDLEVAEQGTIFDSRDGKLRFQPRSSRYALTPGLILSTTSQQVGDDYAPKLDRSGLVNRAEVTNPTRTTQYVFDDTNSQSEYGIATISVTSMAASNYELAGLASWLVASKSTPQMRAGSATVDVAMQSGGSPTGAACLALDVSSVIRIDNLPAQLGGGFVDYFVEGYTEQVGTYTYTITYNLSPLILFTLDNSVRGVLDATYLLAY